MKKSTILTATLVLVFTVKCFFSIAQMPAAISIDPPNATVYDEITLTFDPQEACFENGSLYGAPYVAMHSGVTINGAQWQYVVEFNSTGANGQYPILNMNAADTTYSIVFTPFDFYGFSPGDEVTEICAVFNNGNNWNNDGRDFLQGGPNCTDFFIPIDPGTPPVIPYLHSIVPDNGDQGATVSVQIFGVNTNFQGATTSAWLSNEGETIDFGSVYAVNDTLISAQLEIPGTAMPVPWNIYVENSIDDTLTLLNVFLVNDTTTATMPPAISIYPPGATAFDNITLTLDVKLSCPAGSLFDADSVMIHSGVTIGGNFWQNVVLFDTLGANGQSAMLTHNGDSTWSITYMPSAFYGIAPGTVVEAINCVFNGGSWTSGEAKDYDTTGNCIDFYVPLSTTPVGISPKDDIQSVNIYPNPAENLL
ncbi:MAG: hypothetical protein K8R53_16410, partial [Bacteroidales bacterium]|nr:hypothetical protein [Bacteroidales bacterium]